MEDRPRTSLNGGDLVRSTFIILTFARALAFVASFILVFVFAFLSLFGSEIFAFLFCNGEKRGSGASAESPPVGPLAGSLSMPMAVCGGGLPFIGPVGKRTYTMRGGGDGEGGGVAGEDGSLCGGPGGMPMGRGRSGGRVRPRPVSGIPGGRWRNIAHGGRSEWSSVLVLEAVGCGRQAKVCLARFILRYVVAAVSSIFSFSACLIRSSAN